MKIVIYTAIFGKFDVLRKPKVLPNNVDFVCFTDNKKTKAKHWKIRLIKPEFQDLRKENRKYKILSHKFLPDYDFSIYIDGIIKITGDITKYIDEWLGENDIAVFKHPKNMCIYKEADACIYKKIYGHETIQRQINKYKEEGFPEEYGQTANGFLIRKNTPIVKEFNEKWWNEVNTYSSRDQLSFVYIGYKTGIEYSLISRQWLEDQKLIKIKIHGNRRHFLKLWISQAFMSLMRRLHLKRTSNS